MRETLLRPAVEAALAVAREGVTATPSVNPPMGMRPYMAFKKLSPATVRAVARVVEADDDFRCRVGKTVDEATVGRAAWLWLTRPEGWEDELVSLEGDAAASAAEAADDRAERDARRRLAAARAAAEKATAVATARELEAAEVRAEMVEERARRRVAETHAEQLEAELERIRSERLEAVRQLKEVKARLAERSAEVRETKAQLRDVVPDRDAIASALGAAAQGAADLAAALLELEALVAESTAADEAGPLDPPAASPRVETRNEPVRRALQSLPGGVMDDSVEAVDFLLRVPGIVMLVDGYNVSMAGWPELPVAEQRRRLVGALGEMAARCAAATVEVVFDGAAVEPSALSGAGRHLVRVKFSPPGVEADDVLLDLVEHLPAARPVVVASSDNRVRTGAHRLGANLVHAQQLLKVLRR